MSDPNLIKSLKWVLHMACEFAENEDSPHLDALGRHIDELEATAADKPISNSMGPGGS